MSNLLESIDNGRYKILKHIGGGGFGEVYEARCVETNQGFAVKTEPTTLRRLLLECVVYLTLSEGVGVPHIEFYGKEGGFNVMVIDLLGPSLSKLMMMQLEEKFSLKTTLLLAPQLIQRLEDLHDTGFLHRDIKAGNFLMGTGKNAKDVFLIDFGLSKLYWDCKTHKHVSFREGCGKTGTVRYMSCNTHRGYRMSRRDDLESVAYVLVHLVKGVLPWQGLAISDSQERVAEVGRLKMACTPSQLCTGLPDEFAVFVEYCHGLPFDTRPDYAYCRQLFHSAFAKSRFMLDRLYDWDVLPQKDPEEVQRMEVEENEKHEKRKERKMEKRRLEQEKERERERERERVNENLKKMREVNEGGDGVEEEKKGNIGDGSDDNAYAGGDGDEEEDAEGEDEDEDEFEYDEAFEDEVKLRIEKHRQWNEQIRQKDEQIRQLDEQIRQRDEQIRQRDEQIRQMIPQLEERVRLLVQGRDSEQTRELEELMRKLGELHDRLPGHTPPEAEQQPTAAATSAATAATAALIQAKILAQVATLTQTVLTQAVTAPTTGTQTEPGGALAQTATAALPTLPTAATQTGKTVQTEAFTQTAATKVEFQEE